MTSPAASEMAYAGIRRMLMSGELLPGQRMSQSRLARQLQCSPMPVIEAMRRLESEGLLVKKARKQACVRQLSREDLDGLYLLREAIETVTARLAAQRITAEAAVVLQQLGEVYEQAWENDQREPEADINIHRQIAEYARCPILKSELDRFMLIERTAGRHLAPTTARAGNAHMHRAVIQAIVDHDADSAEYLMKRHIQNGYQDAKREFEAAEAQRSRKRKRRSKDESAPAG